LYSLLNIRTIKSKRTKWVENVACNKGIKMNEYIILFGTSAVYLLGDLGEDGKTVL
jgi:hypothetical protein